MSQHPLTTALNDYRRAKTTKPAGVYSVEEASKRWKLSLEVTRRTLAEMKEAGIVEEVKGHKVDGQGRMAPCLFYRTKPHSQVKLKAAKK